MECYAARGGVLSQSLHDSRASSHALILANTRQRACRRTGIDYEITGRFETLPEYEIIIVRLTDRLDESRTIKDFSQVAFLGESERAGLARRYRRLNGDYLEAIRTAGFDDVRVVDRTSGSLIPDTNVNAYGVRVEAYKH